MCVIRETTHPDINNMTYPIQGGKKTNRVLFTDFSYTPDCSGFGPEYVSTFANGTELPSWITFEPTDQTFDWYSIDLANT